MIKVTLVMGVIFTVITFALRKKIVEGEKTVQDAEELLDLHETLMDYDMQHIARLLSFFDEIHKGYSVLTEHIDRGSEGMLLPQNLQQVQDSRTVDDKTWGIVAREKADLLKINGEKLSKYLKDGIEGS